MTGDVITATKSDGTGYRSREYFLKEMQDLTEGIVNISNKSSMSSKVHYLITDNPNSGTAKNRRAEELGIDKLTFAEFKMMIENYVKTKEDWKWDNTSGLFDDGFEMGIDLEDDTYFGEDEGIELETDDVIETTGSVIAGTFNLSGSSSAISLKSYLETALNADKSIKLTPEEMELVITDEFVSNNLVTQSQKLKDQLLDDIQALEETIKYYKVYNTDILKERIKCINSHIKSVTQACERAKREYSDIIQESYNHLKTIQSTIANNNSGVKATEQSVYILQERYKAVDFDRIAKLRDYRLMLFKNDMILNFLNGYKTVYEKIYSGELQDVTKKFGLVRDIVFEDGGDATVKCSCCNHTFHISEDDFPTLNVGKANYQINILEDLFNMYDSAIKQSKIHDTKFTIEAYGYLKRSAESLGLTELVKQAEELKYYTDRVLLLHNPQIIQNLQKIDPVAYNKYYSQLFNQVKSDVRVTFESFISSTLVINPSEIHEPAVKQLFKTIKVPTLINLLRNRHPLLMKKSEDDVNKNSLTGKAPSVAFEHKRASSVTEYIMSVLEDNFQYPNDSMQYISRNYIGKMETEEDKKQHTSANLYGSSRLDKMSPLRLNMPEIICPECGATLLYYHPIVTAMRTYLVSFMSKSNILDEMDSSTRVNLKQFLSPVVKSTIKTKTDIFSRVENKKKIKNPIKQNLNKSRVINMDAGGTTIDVADVTRTDISETQGIIETIKLQYGFVSDNLATQFYRAQQVGNKLEMDNILNENHRILQQRNDAQAMRIITTQVQELAGKLAVALKENNDAEVDKLIADNSDLIERAKEIDQPFAKAMIEIVESRAKEQPLVEKSFKDYLDEYGDVDLNTLSYEELTSKGLYNYRNALDAYSLSDRDFDCIEAILVKILDDEAIEKLPTALKENVRANYKIIDGIPDELLSSGIIL